MRTLHCSVSWERGISPAAGRLVAARLGTVINLQVVRGRDKNKMDCVRRTLPTTTVHTLRQLTSRFPPPPLLQNLVFRIKTIYKYFYPVKLKLCKHNFIN